MQYRQGCWRQQAQDGVASGASTVWWLQFAGAPFNIQSARDIGQLLFTKTTDAGGRSVGLGLAPPPGCKTKRGFSTTRAFLQVGTRVVLQRQDAGPKAVVLVFAEVLNTANITVVYSCP